MNRLWVRLTLAFAAVTLVAILAVAALTDRQVTAQLPTFVGQQRVIDSGLVDTLAAYYSEHGTWEGVAAVFGGLHQTGGLGNGRGTGTSGISGLTLVLADRQGQIVFHQSGVQQPDLAAGQQLTQAEKAAALPITVDNETAGYLLVTTPARTGLSTAAQRFLAQINQSLLFGGLIASIVGLLAGLVIAYRLSLPLRHLERAARQIAAGNLEQRVPLKGPREVTMLAESFNDMASSLQRSERGRQQLVADVSHELRTPLTVLQGNLRALLDDVYPLQKAEIAALYDESLLLGRLVDDLGELSRAETGQLRLDLRPVALGPIIERAAALFREISDEKGVALNTQIPQNLPLALADPDRLRQVLHNLLANAARHTPAGGRIAVEVAPVEIAGPRAALKPSAGPSAAAAARTFPAVRISVVDSGPGIAPQDLAHVFERFWRADRSRSREQGQGGSGLGLAIAKALAEAQGGQIGVESTPGSGSRFWVTVPVAHAARNGAAGSDGATAHAVELSV